MKEQLAGYRTKISESWGSFPKKTKWMVVSGFLITMIALSALVFFTNRTEFSPLYTNLSPAETGEIKAAIEAQGIPAEVSADGKSISVPSEQVSDLKVSLAAEGIPEKGNVNYSIFSDNMGLGMTDRHFDVVERDAMQNELAGLIRQIDGVSEANVMITLPKENIWITEDEQTATASVVIQGDTGFQLDQKQVNGLYHLISKSVPNLPAEQIVIMDQNGQALAMQEENEIDTTLSLYQQQREIKQDVEREIQRELQQMLGLLMGQDKVVVSVLTSMDFTQERREENLVEPVDIANNEGLEVSVERIVETFSSEGATVEETTGTGETEISNFPAAGEGGSSESERTEERINNEFNRIHRQIETSPYVIDDITINVGVEPPVPGNPASLTPQTIADVSNLLKNTVSASLSMNGTELTEMDLDNRILVFAKEFQGKPEVAPEALPVAPWIDRILDNILWVAAAAVALVLIVGISLFAAGRRRKRREIEEEQFGFEMFEEPVVPGIKEEVEVEEVDLSEFDARTNPKRKTIEKLAKGRPEDFTKLLRSWMSEE